MVFVSVPLHQGAAVILILVFVSLELLQQVIIYLYKICLFSVNLRALCMNANYPFSIRSQCLGNRTWDN